MDHLDTEEKLYAIARLPPLGSIKKIMDEVKKCEVVCSNCHRERTYQRSRRLTEQDSTLRTSESGFESLRLLQSSGP